MIGRHPFVLRRRSAFTKVCRFLSFAPSERCHTTPPRRLSFASSVALEFLRLAVRRNDGDGKKGRLNGPKRAQFSIPVARPRGLSEEKRCRIFRNWCRCNNLARLFGLWATRLGHGVRAASVRQSPPSFSAAKASAVLVLSVVSPRSPAAQVLDAVPAGVHLELVMELGGDFVSEDEMFVRIVGLDVTHDGRLLVLDAGTQNLRVYDLQGALLATIGREGEGPGEFRAPGSMQLIGDTVVVWDWRLKRLSYFLLDGSFLETRVVPELRTVWALRALSVRGSGIIAQTAGGIGRTQLDPPSAHLVHFGGQQFVGLDTLFSYSSGQASWHSRRGSYGSVQSFYEPGGGWSFSGDSLFVFVDGYRGRFEWFRSEAGLVREAGIRMLDLEPQAIEGRERRQLMRDLKSEVAQRYNSGNDVTIGVPEFWSGINRVFMDAAGETWFNLGKQENSTEKNKWYLVSPWESQVRYFRVPHGIEIAQVRFGHVLATTKTEFDSPVVAVYKIVGGG